MQKIGWWTERLSRWMEYRQGLTARINNNQTSANDSSGNHYSKNIWYSPIIQGWVKAQIGRYWKLSLNWCCQFNGRPVIDRKLPLPLKPWKYCYEGGEKHCNSATWLIFPPPCYTILSPSPPPKQNFLIMFATHSFIYVTDGTDNCH